MVRQGLGMGFCLDTKYNDTKEGRATKRTKRPLYALPRGFSDSEGEGEWKDTPTT